MGKTLKDDRWHERGEEPRKARDRRAPEAGRMAPTEDEVREWLAESETAREIAALRSRPMRRAYAA